MFIVLGLLASYARNCAIRVIPLHPDGAGGLKPIARVAIHNQLVVAATGMNVGTLFVVLQMVESNAPVWLGVAAGVAYVTLAPLIFVGPLVPFRPHMLRRKAVYLQRIANQFRRDLAALLHHLGDDAASTAKLGKLRRLAEIHDTIAGLPEWPLDTKTIRRFAAAFLTPGVSVLLSWGFKKIVEG